MHLVYSKQGHCTPGESTNFSFHSLLSSGCLASLQSDVDAMLKERVCALSCHNHALPAFDKIYETMQANHVNASLADDTRVVVKHSAPVHDRLPRSDFEAWFFGGIVCVRLLN